MSKPALRVLLPTLALLAACSDPASRSQAQSIPELAQPTRKAPTDPGSMKSSFAPVVKKTAPAIVNVASRRVVQRQQSRDPFWDFFMGGGGGTPRAQVQGSLGSGAIVRADGVIITNHHNIENMSDTVFESLLPATCWIFGDVLEHLYDPWAVLRRIRRSMDRYGGE